jgi:hypothetical protein
MSYKKFALVTFFLSATLAFAQSRVTDQSPYPSGVQPNSRTVQSSPNNNGTVPSDVQGTRGSAPSTPNQELPGRTNPANAATSDAGTNGAAIRPTTPSSNTARPQNSNSAAPLTQKNESAKKPPWIWIAAAVLVALLLAGTLAAGRSRNPNQEIISSNRNAPSQHRKAS